MKKIVRSGLIAALLLTGVTAAQAQISFGPKVGLNLANISSKYEGDADIDDPDTNIKMGASFGVMLNARFGNLAIQPALTYSMKGAKQDEEETSTIGGVSYTTKYKSSVAMDYLDVPINLVYTTGGDNGFQVFVGPYVAFGIGGKVKGETETTGGGQTIKNDFDGDVKFKGDVKESDDSEDIGAFAKPLDFGINAGVGYLVNNFQIQAGYGLGLANFESKYEGKESDWNSSHRVIHISFAYLFGGE